MESAARKPQLNETHRGAASGDDMDRLKNLLFLPESQRLAKIEAAVAALDSQVGTQDRMQVATAQVLAEALRKAEVSDHERLSAAIAPLVVSVIRSEITNSKDMMVEALYPITGRLVSAGIGVAFAEMLADINARLDRLLSVNQFKLRYLAWRTGRPISELLLAQDQHGTLLRLLFMERGSGHLLAQWQADHGTDSRADLVSGMLAALQNFAQTALGDDLGQLRTLDMGERRIYLRTSASHIVAAEFAGILQPQQLQQLDNGFYDLLDASAGGAHGNADALATFAQSLKDRAQRPPERKKRVSPLAIIGVLVLAAAAWWGWGAWRNWQKSEAMEAALSQYRSDHGALAGWPLKVETDNRAQVVRVEGLVPEVAARTALADALAKAAAPYKLEMQVGIVGAAALAQQSGAQADALSAQLHAGQSQLQSALARIESAQTQAQGQLDTLKQGIAALTGEAQTQAQQLAQTQAQTQQILAQSQTPRAKLQAALSGFAIFFDVDENFLDPAAVKAKLAQIVPLAKAAGGVRVVGYTDNSGGAELNHALSLQRAQAVAQALIKLGLPADRIVESARGATNLLADGDKTVSRLNRRVEIEPLFDGEA
ncbi:MAG: OmpA family protein, partial [Hyphomicrobiales bacterium]|nr:OmpA family protein [Hyphomicrobiales bacterium]